RRYAVGFRRAGAGQLRTIGGCLGGDGQLADCATAPAWRFDGGALRSGDSCLAVAADGTLAVGSCPGGPERRVFVDDEGHVWSGQPPAPAEVGDYAHLYCLAPGGAVACGADFAPAWQFVPATIATPRAVLGLTATGRALRI